MVMGLPGLRCCHLPSGASLPTLGPALSRRPLPRTSALRYSSLQAQSGDSIGEEVLRMFLEERQLHGDFVSKISDMVWRRNGANVDAVEATAVQGSAADVAQAEDAQEVAEDEEVLRLAATLDWVSGDSSAPVRRRLSAKLKDELLLLTTGIGAACTLYCLVVFSLEVDPDFKSFD
nr:unnamed protein product [Digitaria exilis]